jgi:hypothetical protein
VLTTLGVQYKQEGTTEGAAKSYTSRVAVHLNGTPPQSGRFAKIGAKLYYCMAAGDYSPPNNPPPAILNPKTIKP